MASGKMEKPFVYLIKTPLGYYFYDVNRNEIVSVSRELYKYIQNILNDNTLKSVDKVAEKQFAELMDCGYLSTHRVKKVQHPLTNEIASLLERNVDSMTLQVTQDCNLRCGYCVYSNDNFAGQRNHTQQTMSVETAKKSVDFLEEHSIDNPRPHLGFYGGEPLLNFELIRQVVDYAEAVFEGKSPSYAITTNGTLLTDEVIDFLVKHEFNLMISMDGPQPIHDKNRIFAKSGKGSFAVVEKNLRRILEKYPHYIKSMSISMVIDPQNSFEEINRLFHSPVISKIKCVHSIVEKEEPVVYSTEFMDKYSYNTFLGYLCLAKKFPRQGVKRIVLDEMDQIHIDLSKIRLNPLRDIAAPGGPCLPGKMRPMVNCHGDIYPCERISEAAECNCIGSIYSGFDLDKISALLNVGQLSERECMDCWAFTKCNICAKRAEENGVLSVVKKREACQKAKQAALNDLRNKVLLYELRGHFSERG